MGYYIFIFIRLLVFVIQLMRRIGEHFSQQVFLIVESDVLLNVSSVCIRETIRAVLGTFPSSLFPMYC